MIKRALFFIFFVAYFSNYLFAQTDTLFCKNSVFLELFGSSGLVYNVGYERIFIQKENMKIGAAAGFQYNHFWGEHWDNITSRINILIGNKHFFETGIGVIYYYSEIKDNIFFPLRLGYRFQKNSQGLYYKVAFTPLLNKGYTFLGDPLYIIPWAGFTIGYSF